MNNNQSWPGEPRHEREPFNDPFPEIHSCPIQDDDTGMVEPLVEIFTGEDITIACPLGGIERGRITPGFLIGGGKNILVEPPEITPAANKKIWLKITWTINLIDDVVQAGGTMGTATVESGNTVPTDDVPSAVDTSGICYYALGGWDGDTKWVGNGCGSVVIGFCPFVFKKGRQSS